MVSANGVALVCAEATVGVAGIGGGADSFAAKADSNKESSSEAIPGVSVDAAKFSSVETGLGSMVRSSGINDSIAVVSGGSERVTADSGGVSALARFSIESEDASLFSEVVLSQVGAGVPWGSSMSVRVDSGNGLIGDVISSLSDEKFASGSKSWKEVIVSAAELAESLGTVACPSNMGNLGTMVISAR